MLTPHASSVGVSRSPRSRVVIGGASRPQLRGAGPSSRAITGPVKTSASGCSRAPSSSAASHPGQARMSSSTYTSSSPLERSKPLLRAAFSPSGPGWGS